MSLWFGFMAGFMAMLAIAFKVDRHDNSEAIQCAVMAVALLVVAVLLRKS